MIIQFLKFGIVSVVLFAFTSIHNTGSISGTLQYDSGDPVVNAAVTIDTSSVHTDANGNFTYSGLATGTYTITISKGGDSGNLYNVQVVDGQNTSIGIIVYEEIIGM